MTEETREEPAAHEDAPEAQSAPAPQGKTWYPYITKTQFDKFVARLQGRIPDEVDRDYVRAIIRTPSMIYRFLRGIEAMKLIDREQRPTERLRRLVNPEQRKLVMADVLRDLYPELMERWDQNGGQLPDREIADFFRKKTGMGSDSANKMKMFFKSLLSEAGYLTAADVVEEADSGEEREAPETPPPQPPPQPRPEPHRRPPFEQRPGHGHGPAPAPSAPPAPAPAPAMEAGASSSQGSPGERLFNSRGLNEAQRAYLQTLQSVLKINVDGDWDEDMLRVVFDRLERLFDRIRRG